MFIRSIQNPDMMVAGRPYRDRVAHVNTYQSAFPFDRCAPGLAPGPVALVAVHGRAPALSTVQDVWGQAMNGQTKVPDTAYAGTALRVNDIRVTGWGTGLANAGDIYVYDASDTVTAGVPQTATKIFHKVIATENVARGAFYTVPAGCQMQTQQVRCGITDSTTTNRAAFVNVVSTRLVGGKRIRTDFPISGQIGATSGMVVADPDFPLIFDEKTDISLQGTASGAVVLAVYMDAVIFYKD